MVLLTIKQCLDSPKSRISSKVEIVIPWKKKGRGNGSEYIYKRKGEQQHGIDRCDS